MSVKPRRSNRFQISGMMLTDIELIKAAKIKEEEIKIRKEKIKEKYLKKNKLKTKRQNHNEIDENDEDDENDDDQDEEAFENISKFFSEENIDEEIISKLHYEALEMEEALLDDVHEEAFIKKEKYENIKIKNENDFDQFQDDEKIFLKIKRKRKISEKMKEYSETKKNLKKFLKEGELEDD
jgi:hypothetical protein